MPRNRTRDSDSASQRVIRLNMKGEDVKRLQAALEKLGYTIENERGHYGAHTRDIILAVQADAGIEQSGEVDAATLAAIKSRAEQTSAEDEDEDEDDGECNRHRHRRGEGHERGRGEGHRRDSERCDEEEAEPEEDFRYLRGQVRDAEGETAVGVLVKAFDKDMRSEEPLGEARSDLCGFYEIKYKKEQFSRAEKRHADLIVRLYDETDAVTSESTVHFNALVLEVIDLMVGGGEYRGPSEYERLLTTLEPIMQGVALAELTEEDLTFLLAETGIDEAEFKNLRTAAVLNGETGVEIPIHYAFLAKGLPEKLADLLKNKSDVLRAAVEETFEQNRIPFQLKPHVDDAMARLDELRVELALEEVDEEGATSVAAIVGLALPDSERLRKFKALYADHEGPIEEFWQKLREDPDFQEEGLVEAIQTVLRLGTLSQDHVPMVKLLQQGLRDGTLPGIELPPEAGPLAELSDLARIEEAQWRVLLEQQIDGERVGYPASTPGESEEEKLASYAASLAAEVEAAFPTQAVADRVKKDGLEESQDLTRFFGDNPAFDLVATRYDAYLRAHPEALANVTDPATTTARLAEVQRVYHVTSDYAGMRALIERRLSSARSMSRMTKQRFAALYGGAVGDGAKADRVYRRASKISSMAVALYSRYARTMNAGYVRAVPVINPDIDDPPAMAAPLALRDDAPVAARSMGPAAAATAAESQAVGIPDWNSLFGSGGLTLCTCEHCQSVYSPAAYLVDVLNMLATNEYQPEEGERYTAADVLRERRPDIFELDLSCENTNIALPYIDLVNEVLEAALGANRFYLNDINEISALEKEEITDTMIADFEQAGYTLSKMDAVMRDPSGSRWRIRHTGWCYVITDLSDWIEVIAYPQTAADEKTLRSAPQHISYEAYTPLARAIYPWTLPFHLGWEEARLYLGEMGVQRADLMQAYLRETDLHDSDGLLNQAYLDIACERLGVSPPLCMVLSGDVPTEEAWGVDEIDEGEFSKVSTLLDRSGLSFPELQQILDTEFARAWIDFEMYPEHDRYVIVPNPNLEDGVWTCDPDELVVVPSPLGLIDALHRFVRLWRRTGWSIQALDRASSKFGGFDVGVELLMAMATIKQLETELGLPAERILDLWEDTATGRRELLASALRMSGADLGVLADLLGVDPLMDPDGTLAFVRRAKQIQASPFNVADLDYLYRHRGTPGDGVAPLTADLITQLSRLQDALSLVAIETIVPERPEFTDLQRTLAVLYPPEEVETVARFLSGVPADTDENRAYLELYFPHIDVDEAAGELLGKAVGDEAQREAYLRRASEYLLTKVLAHVRRSRGASLVKQSVSQDLSLEADTAKALLESVLTSRRDDTQPLLSDYLSLVGEGVSAAYYAGLEPLGAPVLVRTEPTVDFDWGSGTPAPELNPAEFSAAFTARLYIPESGDYTFQLRTDGGVRLWLSEVPVDPNADAPLLDEWTNALPKELEVPAYAVATPGRAYYLRVHYRSSSSRSFLRLSWKGPSFERRVVPSKLLFSGGELALEKIADSHLRLHKAARLINGLRLGRREIVYFTEQKQDFDGLDLNRLPVRTADYDPAQFVAWLRLLDYTSLRRAVKPGDNDLIDLFSLAVSVPGGYADVSDAIRKLMVGLFAWDPSTIDALLAWFGFGADDFRSEQALLRMRNCVALSAALDTLPQAVIPWVDVSWDDPEAAKNHVHEVKDALKSRYTESQWLDKVTPLSDTLRERRRDALVAYLTANPHVVEGAAWLDSKGIYSHFLIDVDMSPCQLTSRVKQAIGSAQLLVQRALMNLEPLVHLDADDATRWRKWMGSYRVWEANRKVFLYPENWVDPQLRDNKSPFFKELENELLQNEITNASAEEALKKYLQKLDEVARLQVCGMYHEVGTNDDVDRLHVLARTYATPPLYYYRQRVASSYWTPWEKIDLDIVGDHISLVAHNRRLYVFWAMFTEKARADAAIPAAGQKGSAPPTYYEIQLAWSERKNGRWSAKKVSSSLSTAEPLRVVTRNVTKTITDPPPSPPQTQVQTQTQTTQHVVTRQIVDDASVVRAQVEAAKRKGGGSASAPVRLP